MNAGVSISLEYCLIGSASLNDQKGTKTIASSEHVEYHGLGYCQDHSSTKRGLDVVAVYTQTDNQ